MDVEVFSKKLPKCELHAHLSGSISPTTVDRLLEYHRKTWPDEIIPDAPKLTMKGLDFTIFTVIQSITDNPTAVRMATHDVIREFEADGVKYLELRSGPRAVENRMSKMEYCESVVSEILVAKDSGLEIIVRFMLSIDRRKFDDVNEIIELYFKLKQKYPDIMAGIDISGDPQIGDITPLLPKLSELRQKGVKTSIHLAEVLNIPETLEVIKYGPDRIGHGTFIHPCTGGEETLLKELLRHKTPVEVCLTSNIMSETCKNYKEHHAKYLQESDIPIIICTDDKGIFSCSLSGEYQLAMKYFGWRSKDMYELSLKSIEHAFTTADVKNYLREKWGQWKKENENFFYIECQTEQC